MGQLRVVYRATGEFMAIAVRDELRAHGIHSVQLLNEIPMHSGFTFDLRHWADVLVDEQQYATAREVIVELELAVEESDAPRTDWPPTIKVHSTYWLGAMWIALLVARYILLAVSNVYQLAFIDADSPLAFVLWPGPEFLLVICLTALNCRMLGRELLAALAALAALPILAGWLLYELARWVASEVRWLVGFGRQ